MIIVGYTNLKEGTYFTHYETFFDKINSVMNVYFLSI